MGPHRSALLVLAVLSALALCCAAPALALAPAGDGWYWQLPQPQGQLLNSVTMPDGHDAWAVGNGGVIMHSTDGGASWAAQTSPATDPLADVTFTDAEHGCAVGGMGWDSYSMYDESPLGGPVIAFTSDGGTTWQAAPAPGKRPLTGVSFVGQDGWAVGKHGTILHSSDGGATWVRQRSGVLRDLGAVTFTDAQHGFAAGSQGVFVKTVDGEHHLDQDQGVGGVLLVRLQLPGRRGDALGLHGSTGDERGVRPPRGVRGRWPPLAYRRHGLGLRHLGHHRAWSARRADRPGRRGQRRRRRPHGLEQRRRRHLERRGPRAERGAHGHRRRQRPGTVRRRHWSRVVDRRWSDVDGARTARRSAGSLDFVSDTQGWATGGGSLAVLYGVYGSGTTSGSVLHTADGATWQEQLSEPGRSFSGVDFADAEHGWVVGSRGAVRYSADGGATWTRQASGTTAYLTQVGATGGGTAWAMGFDVDRRSGEAPVMVRTTDSGAHWLPVTLPARFYPLAMQGLSGDADGRGLGARPGWCSGTPRTAARPGSRRRYPRTAG